MRYPSVPPLLILLGVVGVQACSDSKPDEQAGSGSTSANGGSTSLDGNTSLTGGSTSPAKTSSARSSGGVSSEHGGAAGETMPTSGGGIATGNTTDVGSTPGSGGSVLSGSSTRASSGGAKAQSSAKGGASASGGASSQGGAKDSGENSLQGGTRSSGSARTTASGTTTGGTTSTSGQNVCGTAAEDASATLTCPSGQVIDSVVFASYGTPTGTCGGFQAGSCDAASSKTTVESLCVGRRSCTVPATNSAFTDPCSRTTKKLAVEVTCVEGAPVATPETPYKGIANSPASQITALGATWCYNWGTTPKSTDCADPYFVPMVWGGGDVAGAIKAIGNAGYTTVLGFNEPNKKDQANMTVAEAIAAWPTLTSNSNIRVGSPAVSDDGRSWLQDFMTQAKSKGLRVDFIAMHWYGWNAGSCVASQLEGAIKWASQWGLPIWITEFGCMGSSNPDEQTLLKFFSDAIPMLDNHPLVERYAWYPWNTYNELYKNNVMTALGKAFAAAPQYRE